MNYKIEEIKQSIIKENFKATTKTSIIVAFILLIEVGLCIWNRGFIALLWIPILPLIHIFKRNIFLKNAVFCWGRVIDVTLDDCSDINLCIKIEFKDCDSNKVYEIKTSKHWGDYYEEDAESIKSFFEDGKKRIGKEIPVFYNKKNPNKNLVFIDYELMLNKYNKIS